MGGKNKAELAGIKAAIEADPALEEAMLDVVTGPSTVLTAAIASSSSSRPQLFLSTKETGALALAEALRIGAFVYHGGRYAFHGNRLVMTLLTATPKVEEVGRRMVASLTDSGTWWED